MQAMDSAAIDSLTIEEQQTILSVLKRNEELEKKEEEKIRALRKEIEKIKSIQSSRDAKLADKECAVCNESFGWMLNKGAPCPKCQQKICDKCRYSAAKDSWICTLCFSEKELEAMTNQWFYSKFRQSKRSLKTNKVITGPNLVKARLLHKSFDELEAAPVKTGVSFSDNVVCIDDAPAMNMTPTAHSPVYDYNSMADKEQDHNKNIVISTDMGIDIGANMEATRNASYGADDENRLHYIGNEGEINILKDDNFPHADVEVEGSAKFRPLNEDFAGEDLNASFDTDGEVARASNSATEHVLNQQLEISFGGISSEGRNGPDEAGDIDDLSDSNSKLITSEDLKEVEPILIESGRRLTSSDGEDSPDEKAMWVEIEENGVKVRKPLVAGGLEVDANISGQQAAPPSGGIFDDDFFNKPLEVGAWEGSDQSTTDAGAEKKTEEGLEISVQEAEESNAGGVKSNNDLVLRETKPVSMAMDSPSISVTATSPGSQATEPTLTVSNGAVVKKQDSEEVFVVSATTSPAQSVILSQGSKDDKRGTMTSQTSQESLASQYSNAGAGSKIQASGEVEFDMKYNYAENVLSITVHQCRDLAIAEAKKKRTDPYVKVYLLPDKTKSGKRKTKVKKRTTNPVYNEVLKYNLKKSELQTRTLWLSVWHNDAFGRNTFLGEVNSNFDSAFGDPSPPKWHRLQDMATTSLPQPVVSKGELKLALSYKEPKPKKKLKEGEQAEQQAGELHVLIKQATNLTGVRSNGYSNSFCLAYLLPDKGEKEKKKRDKTAVVKRSCNPDWNHTFVYPNVTPADLRERCLELTIWDKGKGNDFLGGVRIGLGQSHSAAVDWMDSRGDEVTLWQVMLDKPNQWNHITVPLRPTMDKRSTMSPN